MAKIHGHLQRAGIRADADELKAFGRQGLVEAAQRFDPSLGDDFRRFAYFRVRGSMLDGLRKMNHWSRRGYERIALLQKMNEARGGSLDDEVNADNQSSVEAAQRLRVHMASMVTAMTLGVFADHALQKDGAIVALDKNVSAEDELADQETAHLVREAIGHLPPPEDEVVRRFYVEGHRMDSIAEDMGCSRSWVSRIHSRALKRLGPRLRSLRD